MRRALTVGLLLGVLWACDPQLVIGNPSDGGSGGGVSVSQGTGGGSGGGATLPGWFQQAYAKASNTGRFDHFGSVSLSVDGNTLAVGAVSEDSSATGANGNQNDNSATDSGAVYVFTRSGGSWTQQAYLKASNTEANDYFGGVVSLSGDGNTLAVGASGEDSRSTGVNGAQGDNSAPESGAVYVFTRNGGVWTQQVYLKASNTDERDFFGEMISLSGSGNTLAVGARGEASTATGVNGSQGDNSAWGSGAVYVFSRGSGGWVQQAYLKASNTEADDRFGTIVSLSEDGDTLAVGAPREDSSATGINGDQGNNSAIQSGAVYVFSRAGGTWTQQAYLKAFNAGGLYLASLSVSGDGRTIAVAGVEGVYIVTRVEGSWAQQAYLKASNSEARDEFGGAVSLSTDGNSLAVGAWEEDSNATGVGGDQGDNSARGSGAVYRFTRTAAIWAQQTYLKASNAEADDGFGALISLSGDGKTLAVGVFLEDSSATGIDGSEVDNSASDSGAVYVFSVHP